MINDEFDNRPWRLLSEVHHLFAYKSAKSAYNAVHNGTFPVETYLLSGKRVVDVEVMNKFFEKKRDEGMRGLG